MSTEVRRVHRQIEPGGDHSIDERHETPAPSPFIVETDALHPERAERGKAVIEPKLIKAAQTAAKPLLALAKEEWKRRGASPQTPTRAGDVDRELDEALDLLTGDGATLREWSILKAKSALADRPAVFTAIEAREWLRIPEVRSILRDAFLATVVGESVDSHRAEAARRFATASGEPEWYGGTLFDYAVAFLSLSIEAKTPVAARLGIAAGNRNRARLEAQIAEVGQDVAALGEAVDLGLAGLRATLDESARSSRAGFPADIVGKHILAAVDAEMRWRNVVDPARTVRVVRLAERVAKGGDLRLAPDDARIAAMRFAAATLAREGAVAAATGWLDEAEKAGADDLASDRARVAIQEGDLGLAAALLADRDDRMSQSLAADLVRLRDGEAAALEFVERHVPLDGVTGFLVPAVAEWAARGGRWDFAEHCYASATAAQMDENPTLLFARARFRIAMLGPEYQRLATMESSASLPRPFSVRNDLEGAGMLEQARTDLAAVAELVEAERLPDFAVLIDVHRIYLDLLSGQPDLTLAATDRLIPCLASFASVVDYAWLALAFDIEFDEGPLRASLDRARSLGGWTQAQLVTAFQLTMHDDHRGADVALFIADNREALMAALGAGQIVGTEIEALARQGRVEEGRTRLEEWRSRLESATAGRLEAILDESEGGNPIAIRLARFEETDEEADLLALIAALADAEDARLGDYSAVMWRRSHRLQDAARACDSFFNHGRDEPLDELLAEIGSAADGSPRLSAHAAWSSYRAGDIDDALRRLGPLRADAPDDPSLRQLEINMALDGGDWRRLSPLVREDLDRRDRRSPRQLLQASGIAHAIDDPVCDDLARGAVDAAPDDVGVLLGAFEIAVKRGRDWGKEGSRWLARAVELSGESGPLQQRRLRDMVEIREQQVQRANRLDGMVMAGNVPLAMVAGPLGTTLSELILSRLAANVAMADRRGRLCLPFVAGNRLEADMSTFTRVGLDLNAILGLQLCGLLQTAIDALPAVVIPSGTLPSIFFDLTRSDRSQPSRVEQCARIRRMVSDGRIAVIDPPEGDPDPFDALHAAAKSLDGILVHEAPVYVAGSFMEEERDVEAFTARLAAPISIAEELVRSGAIGTDEAEAANGRLTHLGRWTGGADPDLDRPLVLDGVCVFALDDAGLLEPLIRTGARLHIPRSVVDLADGEARQRADAQELARAIEGVRAILHAALTSGRATLGRQRRDGRSQADAEDLSDDPAIVPLRSLLQDGSSVDVVVSGDRMVNRFGGFTDGTGTSRPVLTIVDLIDHLARTGAVSASRRTAAMRKLREAGVGLMPTDGDEIAAAAASGNWSKGPPRDLAAICDSIQLPLLRHLPILPDDGHWLRGSILAMAIAIRKCWAEMDVGVAEKAADHILLNLPWAPGWIEGDADPGAAAWALEVTVAAHALLALPFDVRGDRLDAYHGWYRSRVQPLLEGRDAKALAGTRERLGIILTERNKRPEEDGVRPDAREATKLNRLLAGLIPPFHLQPLMDEAPVREALGAGADAIDVDGLEVEVAELAAFLTGALDGASVPLVARNGVIVAQTGMVRPDGSVAIDRTWGTLRFDFAGLFSGDGAVRSATLDALLASATIAPSSAIRWRDVLTNGPLPTGLFSTLMDELRRSPEAFVGGFLDDPRELTFEDVAKLDDRALSSLLDRPEPATDLPTMLAAVADAHARSGHAASAARALASLTVAPEFRLPRLVDGLDDAAVAGLCTDLIESDAFSLVAAFDTCCERRRSPECVAVGTAILAKLLDEPSGDRLAHDWSIAARLTLAGADLSGALAGWPLASRRCALLAHAGHVARVLAGYDFDRDELWSAADAWVAARYRLRGYAERSEAPAWVRDWLTPAAVQAYLLRRLTLSLEAIDAAERPEPWVEAVKAATAALATQGLTPLLLIPGPLDGFPPGTPPSDPIESGRWTEAMANANPVGALNALFFLVSAFGPPDDLPPMINAVVDVVRRADPDHREQALRLGLAAAAKWRSDALADRLIDDIPINGGTPAVRIQLTAEFMIAAAATRTDEDAFRNAALTRLEALCSGPLAAAEAVALANLLGLACNTIPAWAPRLEPLKTAVLLAA